MIRPLGETKFLIFDSGKVVGFIDRNIIFIIFGEKK